MDKAEILSKLMELKRLKRELDDLAQELKVGCISEDKIYIAIITYHSILTNLLKDKTE